MKSQVASNTFSGGMLGDIDPHEQPNNTFRYAIGGRLVFNSTDDQNKTLDENVKDGKTRAFVNAKGNKYAISLCPGYQLIGSTETREGSVIYSTNGLNSEIGFLVINDNVHKNNFAEYYTLFNDRNDPNGDLLHFDIDHYVSNSFCVYENEFTERVYWVDGYNQKRVFNLKQFYDSTGSPIHPKAGHCDSVVVYPKFLSVHAFSERMDLVFPKLKFWKRIPGKLKSGQIQLVMKYKSKNGHTSVWSPISRPVFVTDQKIDIDQNISGHPPDSWSPNHHHRCMGNSNIISEEGQAWEISGIDTRWDQIVIGYIYHASSEAFQEANEYKTIDISGTDMVIELKAHTGVAITKEELNQRFETILAVGSTAIQENRTWEANLELLPDLTLDLSGVIITPAIRYYKPDATREPGFDPVFNPVTGRDDNDPITNTVIEVPDFKISNFTGSVESYGGGLDYQNYKGQLFNFLYKGYFRGETYGFAMVVFDRKGNPFFAQHITDYTFPNQFDTKDPDGNPTNWTLSRQNADGSFDLRILGCKFSNITLPAHILRDKFGKLNISGFSIVRCERVPRIANQGIMVNCNIGENAATDTDDLLVHGMEFWDNKYQLTAQPDVYPNAFTYLSDQTSGSDYGDHKKDQESEMVGTWGVGTFFNYHSPDILIQQKLENEKITKDQMLAGQMQKVGFAHKAFSESVDLGSAHYYTKSYKTLPLEFPDEAAKIKHARARIGTKSRIKLALVHDQDSLHRYEKFDPETADQIDYTAQVQAWFWEPYLNIFKATQQPYSVIMKLLDWKLIDSIESENSKASYAIVNWTVTPDNYYTAQEESSLETRRYFSTGHFQPITESILDKSVKTLNTDGSVKSYTFNDVEVWGGDAYVNLFDFTRLYPQYADCEKDEGAYPDYSISMIVPNESKYNLALLYGRRFAANAVMPQRTSCESTNTQLANGIMPKQPEDWSYNEVLLLEENTKFYFPKPADLKLISKQDSTIRWSPKKLYGEMEDSFRQKLPGDFIDVIGEYGPIMSLQTGYSYIYVIQQKAFGALLTRSERFIPSDSGQISVTSGAAVSAIRYISKSAGTQHPNSVAAWDDKIIFTDARQGKINIFNQSGLRPESEDDGLNDPITAKTIFFDSDITHKNGKFLDIIAGVDKENGDFHTTFRYKGIPIESGLDPQNRQDEMKSFTLSYSTKNGKWHGNQHFTPNNYLNLNRYSFSTNPTQGKENEIFIYNHGKYGRWFGQYYPTILEFIVAPNANVAKIFDNMLVNVNYEGWGRISKVVARVNSNIHTLNLAVQSGGIITRPDDRLDFYEDMLKFPLFEDDSIIDLEKERLRGHYMVIRIEIDNSQQVLDSEDLQVAISNVDTKYRISAPVQY